MTARCNNGASALLPIRSAIPWDYLPLSQTPVWEERHLLPRSCMLRVFAAWPMAWVAGRCCRRPRAHAGGDRDVVSIQRGAAAPMSAC